MTQQDPSQTPPDSTPQERASLQAALGDRYRVDRKIGEGGMATVFLAEDLKHHRNVAVKVLRDALAHTIGIRRFLQEIEVIARLQHPHLLSLIDSGDAAGLPYYVMPYVEAQSLRELIDKEGRMDVDRAVAIALEVADGLHFAHQQGIIHRDIKPANILMSGGHAVVADFGIAAALEKAAVGRLTETGSSLGSPTYMSPEQAAAERDLDARSDVYSLACVLYEMLCGAPPNDDVSMQRLVKDKLTGSFVPLRTRRPAVPSELEAAIHTALAAEKEQRFDSMLAFAQALSAALASAKSRRPSIGQTLRKPRILLPTIAAVSLLGLAGAWTWTYVRDNRWARQIAIPQIERAAEAGEWDAAYELATRAERVIPRDSALKQLWPRFSWVLSIPSDPSGARVFRRPYSDTAAWTELGTTPLDSVRFPFGYSVLRFEHPGYAPLYRAVGFTVEGSTELMRLAPYKLDTDSGLPAGKVRVPARIAELDAAFPNARPPSPFGDFFLGRFEVTNREYKRFVDAEGYRQTQWWEHAFVRNGKTLSRDKAIALLTDKTGRHGPATWEGGDYPVGQGDYPVGGVSWYEAAAYARFVGQELPTVHHWRHAFDVTAIPWLWRASNMVGAGPVPVGKLPGISWPGAYDMAGNVREWCFNATGEKRFALGGAWTDEPEFYSEATAEWSAQDPFDRLVGNGFRLAITHDDSATTARLRLPIAERQARDVTKEPRATDEAFAAYRAMYAYDSRALEAKIEDTDSTSNWIRERVMINAAYGQERVALYLFTPRTGTPPFQTLVYYPGGNAGFLSTIDQYRAIHYDFLLKSGRAVAFPIYPGTFERQFKAPAAGPTEARERRIRITNDVRRAVEYLVSRPDIDSTRLAYYGYSAGGERGPLSLVLEPRFRAGILYMAGLSAPRPPEIDPATFLPRVKVPVLLLSGALDYDYEVETSAKPFFRLLGTAAKDKRHVIAEGGHFVARPVLIRESLDWLDRYLGKPK